MTFGKMLLFIRMRIYAGIGQVQGRIDFIEVQQCANHKQPHQDVS